MAIDDLPSHLPRPPDDILCHANLQDAYNIISGHYDHALSALWQHTPDPIQVSHHIDSLMLDAVPVLARIDEEIGIDRTSLVNSWLTGCAEVLGEMVCQLGNIKERAIGLEDRKILFPTVVETIRTGRPGRPKKIVDLDFLRAAMAPNRNISIRTLAKSIGINRNTLHSLMKDAGIYRRHSDVSNDELDHLVRTFKSQRPESGYRYLMGFLRQRNLRIQQHRVVGAMRRVDALGQRLRERRVIRRRKYYARRPNAVWHVDGNHKLIRWGIVIHGFVDGFCRTITGLRASNNNKADTVLSLLRNAIDLFGMPSRVRGDRGGENIASATYMVMCNGPGRASFIWGTSTHNTRIERMWAEAASQFIRRWRSFFMRLERLHCLDPERPEHLWLLHMLFLDAINIDCQQFQQEWNAHPIAGANTQNKSPNDLRLLGQLQFGIYKNNTETVHPNTLDHYGDGDNDTINGMAMRVRDEQWSQIRHEGICAPDHRNPFVDPKVEVEFLTMLRELVIQDVVPVGYGLREEEWENNLYPSFETLPLGKRGTKSIAISLSDPIWFQRAILWGKAVNLLNWFTE